jgi:hypothetical protein
VKLLEFQASWVQVGYVKIGEHTPSLSLLSTLLPALEAVGGVGCGGGSNKMLFVRALVSVACGTTSAMIVT